MKRLILRAMRGCGLFSIARLMSAHKARILMYHNFSGLGGAGGDALSVEGARRQFSYLRSHFRVVPLLQVADRVASGASLDPYTVALTIDDGRRNCYEFLFPLLKEFELPATFFVVSSFIQGEDWLWTDKVLWLSEQPSPPAELASGKLPAVFKSLNRLEPKTRDAHIAEMAASKNISIPRQPPAKYAPCSWSELREMADSGLVEIGSHTVSHPILSTITDEESWYELTESRRQIDEGVKKTVSSFCFPNGRPEDYRSSQVRQVAEAGYGCAVVTDFGLVGKAADRYRLPRLGMGIKSEPLEIAKYLDGFAYYQWKLGTLFGRPSTP